MTEKAGKKQANGKVRKYYEPKPFIFVAEEEEYGGVGGMTDEATQRIDETAGNQPPEKIWLQLEDYESDDFGPTWRVDQINDSDVEYVRVSEIGGLREENERLSKKLTRMIDELGMQEFLWREEGNEERAFKIRWVIENAPLAEEQTLEGSD